MKILIAGDFCPQNRVASLIEQKKFEDVLSGVKEITAQADYSIVNFECPVTCGNESPISKQGPNLHCTPEGIEAVYWTGFNAVTLANNHFLDYGAQGVKNTLDYCKNSGIDVCGGGMTLSDASKILFKEINGKRLAVINCCEHEFSISTPTTAGSNPLNPVQQYYAIKEARQHADFVLVITHGGHEMWQLPSPRMKETYRFFIDAGADAVVNHHQHCFSGYETYNGKPIFYGLGNFCFDRPSHKNDIWNYGYMVMIDFENEYTFTIFPYKQCGESPCVSIIPQTNISAAIDKLNTVILDEKEFKRETDNYYRRASLGIKLAFEPYRGRILNKLYRMGILPSFLSKSKKLRLRNLIDCEAHRDKTIYLFTQQL